MKRDLPIAGAGGGGGKGGGGESGAPREAADNLRSQQFAQVIDAVCEGEIEGLVSGLQSVFLDDTPAQNPDGSYNFTGVTLVSRNGTQAQAYIPGFPAVEAETAVTAEIKYGLPVVRSVSNANVNAARITVSVPQLTYQDPSSGDLNGSAVTLTIEVQSNGGGYVPAKLRQVTQLLNVAGATANSGAYQIMSAQLVFHWTGELPRSFPLPIIPGYQTVQWRIDYRVVGAPDWTVFKSGSFSGSATQEWIDESNYETTAPSADGTAAIEPLAENYYEFRIVKTSGYGIVAFVAGGDPSANIWGTDWLTGRLLGGAATVSGCTGMRWDFTDVIEGKTSSRYQRAYRIPLTGSPPWDIRVGRLTADSTQANLRNETWWDSYTEIIDAKLTYPNTALQALRVDSSQFRAVPRRGYELKLLKVLVPSNYAPLTRVYTGVWDGTFTVAWTDNPAWCFYDLLTNDRYGLGAYLDAAQVDKWGLYQIAQYCDELVPNGFGGEEPRFTCNLYLQTREEAYKVIQSMASIFRAMAFWSGGALNVMQDAPSGAVALFTPANVIDGQFAYSGSGARTRHTVALVSWNDPADRYKQKIEYVEDAAGIAQYGVQQAEIVAVGCNSRGQAHRIGRWMLYSERMETETVSFAAGLDGTLAAPGEVIQTSDPVRAGKRLGGRLLSATASNVTLDAAVDIETGKTYTLWAVLPDGTVESRTVTTGVGSTDTLAVAPDFSDTPRPLSIWVLAASDLVPETWRVLAVAEAGGGERVEITALAYRADKFAAVEQDLVLEPLPISALAAAPAVPTNITVEESLYRVAGGDLGTRITLSWEGAAAYYEVWWRLAGGNFALVNVVHPTCDIDGVAPGDYEFKLHAKNAVGLSSIPAYAGATILGKTAPPSDVTGFTLTGTTLRWSEIPDLDAFDYAICRGAAWGEPITYYAATSAPIEPLAAGAYTWRIRARDTTGNLSVNEATVAATISAPATPVVTANLAGDAAVLAWNDCTATYQIDHYAVRHGASWEAGTPIGQAKALSMTLPADWTGDRTFWVAGVDIAGNTGVAGGTTETVSAPAAPGVSAGIVGEEAVIAWTVPASSLPLETYEVRHGASWAAGASLGTVKGTRLAFLVDWAGSRTFWVAATDVQGNTGAAGSASVNIAAAPAPSLTAQVIDNNVLLYWTQVAGTVPTRTYELRRGAAWASAEVIGEKSGGFTSVFETTGGVYTYWAAAIDTAGNTGPPAATAVTVSQPPDYVLKSDYDSAFAGTKSNLHAELDGSYLAPISPTETFAAHFTARAWAAPQDQINAGYPVYAQPAASPGYYEETLDYGAVLASNRITVTLAAQALVGTVTQTCKISVSEDGAGWTDYDDVWEVYATGFRYVKVRVTFTSASDTDFLRVSGLNIRLDSKLKTVTRMVACDSADTGGTLVYLTDDGTATGAKLFIDVDAIAITPQGTTPVIPMYDFVDAPNPLDLKILLFNTGGARVSGTASLMVRGF